MGIISSVTNSVLSKTQAQATADNQAKIQADKVAAVKAQEYQNKLDLITAKDYIAKLEAAQIKYNTLQVSANNYIAELEKLATYRANPAVSTGHIADNGLATVVFDLKSDGLSTTAYLTSNTYVETITDTNKTFKHSGSIVINSTPTADGTVTINIPISAGDIKLVLYHENVVDVDTVEIVEIGTISLVA